MDDIEVSPEQEALEERNSLIGDFCRETEESLDALEQAIAALRPFVFDMHFSMGDYVHFLHGKDLPTMLESLRVVNRLVHTVKGVSSFLDLTRVNTYCHAVEDLTIGLTRGQIYMDSATYGVIVAIPVVLNRFLEAARSLHSDESVSVEAELAEVESCREAILARMGGGGIHYDEVEGKDLGRIRDFKRDLRVNIQLATYDNLLHDYQAFSQDILQTMKASHTDMAVIQRIEKGLTEHLEQLLLASQGEIVLSRYPRLATDLAAHLGKKVGFSIRRNEAWARPDIWDRCHNALVHMVRNAVDHGIELPEERTAAGKGPEGHIVLEVYEDFRNLYLMLEDDGKGIDPQQVGKSAVEKGVIRAEQLAGMDDEEIQRLIFHSGFSTRRETSDVSGRGVGMDAVLKEIESHLNGRVHIDSKVGRGTRFTLEIPKMETLSECICFGDARYRYAIPVVADLRYLECEPQRVKPVLGGTSMYVSESGEFPLLNLFPQLHPDEYAGMSMNLLPIIQIGRGEEAMGFVVPQIYGQERIKIDRRRNLRRLTRDDGLIFGYGLTDPITMVLDLDFLKGMI